MKYCSYCGAVLVDGAVSFCAECGKQLQVLQDNQHNVPVAKSEPEHKNEICRNTRIDKKRKPVKKPRQSKRKAKQPQVVALDTELSLEDNPPDDGYDGYYNDITPVDDGQRMKEKLDPYMIKKVVLIAGGTILFVIIAIVALLYM